MIRLISGACLLGLFSLICVNPSGAYAQKQDRYFRIASPSNPAEKDYGQIRLAAGKNTLLIHSLMAFGENVKSFTVSINGGFPFKLAPAPSGQNLNYVASSLQIVLQPGDEALFSFVTGNNTGNLQLPSARHIYLTGQTIDP
jgi:hypothetical protein